MLEWIVRQSAWHWYIFGAAFLVIGLWESYRPFRLLILPNGKRWALHLGLAVAAQCLMFLMPMSAALVASAVREREFGLLAYPAIPLAAQGVAGFLLLDFVRWGQHFCFHRVSWLWRMHRVHHSDPDYDLTTTLRFHPLEAFVTQVWYLAMVALIAPPPAVAVGVELLLLAQNFFGHANVRMPRGFEAKLRRFLVTPDMHRVHHSVERSEQNSNYGSVLPYWDRWFGTYQHEAAAGADHMQFGLAGYEPQKALDVAEVLVLPFRPLSHMPEPSSLDVGQLERH